MCIDGRVPVPRTESRPLNEKKRGIIIVKAGEVDIDHRIADIIQHVTLSYR